MDLNIKQLSFHYDVRRFTEEDVSDIYELCKGNPTYYHHMKMEPTCENIKSVLTELPPGVTMKDKFFLGFYRERELIAILDLITGYPDAETAYIGWFMMKKALQGKGIGSQMIGEILCCLKTAGFQCVRLGYVKGNPESEGFWRKNGFLPTGKESKTESYTAVIMQRPLEECGGIRLIRATDAWLDSVIRIRLEMLKVVNDLPEDASFDEKFVNASENYFKKADQTTVLAVDREVIGCATICYIELMPTFDHPTGKRAHIMNVYTRKNYRRQGIAYQMMKMLMEEARQRGVTEISLDATAQGRPLYERCGFKDSKEGMIYCMEESEYRHAE